MRAPVNTALSDQALLSGFEKAALDAGRVIMKHYTDGCAVTSKADRSPVTEADHAAEAIILSALAKILPGVPVVAEEEVAAGRLPASLGRRFLLVDPLDGTREFLLRNGDFTVNIGLIEDGVPVAGVVYAPARNLLFIGAGGHAEEVTTTPEHETANRRKIRACVAGDEQVAVCSRSHNSPETADFLNNNRISGHISVGSSLKFCMIARGEADIYPRCSATMEWDTAAGDAVLRASGGMTSDLDGKPLVYGERFNGDVTGFANPHFIAYGAGPVPSFFAQQA